VRFSLRGYPKSNTEKLILVVISRYIERIAARAGRGRHRASFQSLSRINDERGTRAVYERLADTDLDVHVYGRPDWIPSRELDVTTHAGDGPDFRDSWFVLYTPDAEPSDSDATADPAPNPNTDDTPSPHPVALLAIETEPREWEAFWTFDPSLVADLNASIRRRL
jgi:hypothetical protein